MLPAFDFFSVPRITFGRGKLAILPTLVAPLGPTVLLVHNGGDGPRDRVAAALSTSEVRLVPYRQKGEPTVADVDDAVAAARRAGCTGVIGAGGGSAIDLAKAVAGLLGNGGSALDYMEVVGRGQPLTKPAALWIAVPTTAGTGAEVTRNAVIGTVASGTAVAGDRSKRFKASLRSERLLPLAALIDPELQVGVPPDATAWSGMDALCQCVEAYTSRGANPLTDGLALRGITLAAAALRQAHADGGDLDAREAMAAAALLGGVALTNAGLGAVHGFAAPLGANYDAPHGAICAALLPPVMAANVAAAEAAGDKSLLARYADVGRAMSAGDVASASAPLDPSAAVRWAVEGTRRLAGDLRTPPLKAFGLTVAAAADMVALAKRASSMKFNPVVLGDDVLARVLAEAIEG
jgi:alcohol dehydrogenase class IV